MKKLLIVALMALLAAGAFAQEVKFGGQIEYETSSSLKSDDAATTGVNENYGRYDGDITLIATITADEYNTGVIRIHKNIGNTRLSWLDRAHVTTDVGKFFGLPVGWKSQVGLNDWGFAPSGNAKWDTLHRVIQRMGGTAGTAGTTGDPADYFFDVRLWGIKESFVIDALTINAFFSLNGNASGADREDAFPAGASPNAGYSKLRDLYIHAKYAQKTGSGDLGVDVAYMLWTGAGNNVSRDWTGHDKPLGFGDGTMLLGIGYTGIGVAPDMTLDVGAAWYQALSKASFSGYGVNAQLNVAKLFYAVVGAQGYLNANKESEWGTAADKSSMRNFKGEVLHNIRIGAGVSPVPFFSLDAGVLLYMGDEQINDKDGVLSDREMFNTLDISAALKVGKMEYRLGYLLTPINDSSIDPFCGGDNNLDTNRRALYFKARLGF
jgi:hypothetical protein